MRYLRPTFCLTMLMILWGSVVTAQDFSKTYQLGPDGIVNVKTVSGDVKVTGYDGNAVVVTGHKEGRDKERVLIEDRSSANRVDVGVKYPEDCRCDATVHFEVRVPRAIRLKYDAFSSVSGDVSVTDVIGDLNARSVSGSVTIRGARGRTSAKAVSGSVTVEEATGSVNASSTSGRVLVELKNLEGADEMEFTTVSGGVTVRMPGNLDANVEMSVLSGDLKTDFPLQIEEKSHGPGRRAFGQVGNGTRKLRVSSVSGSVSLLKL